MRTGKIVRNTKETNVSIDLNIDGNGNYNIETDFRFFKHMLEQFAYHSGFDLTIKAKSLDGDEHHLVEDVALALGNALKEAIADKKGINRYGQFILPMDEALVLSAVDLSGRAYSRLSLEITDEKISDFSTVLLSHFFSSFAQNAVMTVHIRQLDGNDPHHIAEAVFKSFARSLRIAVSKNNLDEIPSTKGIL